jgi:hypothetical protein
MNKFSQFNIKVPVNKFIGDKIKISKILNREIIVYYYKLGDSKIFKEKGTCKCLELQISVDDNKHIIFTSASGLIEVIKQIPENDFPFITTIIEENDRYIFT